MKNTTLLVIASVLITYSFTVRDSAITPDITPVPNLDMVSVFSETNASKSAAKDDALRIASVLDGLSEVIKFDGNLQTPKISSDLKVEDFRVIAREYAFFGATIESKYPKFGAVVGEYLDKQLGIDPVREFTPERRNKWVHEFKNIATACRYAAGKL